MLAQQLLRDLGLHGNVAHEVLVHNHRPWRRWFRRISLHFRHPYLDLLGPASLFGLGLGLGSPLGQPLRLGAGASVLGLGASGSSFSSWAL